MEEIDDYFKKYVISLNILEQYADILNFKKPFSKHFSSSSDINSANNLTLNNLYFNPTIIKTYGGIIFEEITEDREYAYT